MKFFGAKLALMGGFLCICIVLYVCTLTNPRRREDYFNKWIRRMMELSCLKQDIFLFIYLFFLVAQINGLIIL